MKQKHSFGQILDQITDLLALTEENKGKAFPGKLDDKIKSELEVIEQEVELFQKLTDEAIKRSGIKQDEQLKESPASDLTNRDRRILKRAEKLKKEIVSEKRYWSRQSHLAKMQEKKAKTTGKKRKKKFKRLGGQGWMPL
ncbi:MAG: hypothetical protein WB791_03250 [Waddliaceae bacterium]